MKKLMIGLAVAVTAMGAWATTYRVVPTAADKTGDWADAYTSVNDAVNAAKGVGDVVLVKSGTYTLSTQLMLQADDVTLRSDDGTGRIDPVNTVLKGNGTVRLVYTNAKKRPVFDGFTFTNGVANAGAGLYVAAGAGAYKILNSTITGCVADGMDGSSGNDGWGAGLYTVDNSGGLVSNCVFRANRASKAKTERCGAAIYATGSDVTTVRDCTFEDNRASGVGPTGGAIAARGKMLIFDSSFKDNTCTTDNGSSRGGHAYVGNNSVISGCTFSGEAQANYGTCVESSLNAFISNCVFSVRSSNHYGIIKANGSTQIVGCRFVGCETANSVIYTEATPVLRNSLVAGNEIRYVVHNQNAPRIVIEHCTVANNTYVNSGKALNFNAKAKASTTNVVVNSLFEGATLENYNDGTSIRYVLTTNCYTGVEAGFVGRAHGDYRLKSVSPCVDAGTNLTWTAAGKDVAGRPRTVGLAPDIGCYERQPDDPETYVVRAVATDADRTGDWADAFVGLQSALDATVTGDAVWVREGMYASAATVVVPCRELTLKAVGSVVLDGGNARRIMSVDNSTGYPKIVIDGFTFKDGNAGFESTGCNGGGLFFRAGTSGPSLPCGQVLNCVFTNCAAYHGGGLYLQYGGIVSNCQFVGNVAVKRGGGVCLDSVDVIEKFWETSGDSSWHVPRAEACTAIANESGDYGGGISSGGLACQIVSCVAVTNKSARGGNVYVGRTGWLDRSRLLDGYGASVAQTYGYNAWAGRDALVTDCILSGGVGNYGSLGCGGQDTGVLVERCAVTNEVETGNVFFCCGTGATVRDSLVAGRYVYLYAETGKDVAIQFENSTFDVGEFRLATAHATTGIIRASLVNSIVAGTFNGGGKTSDTYGQYLVMTNCCFTEVVDTGRFSKVETTGCCVNVQPFENGYLPKKTLSDKGLLRDWMTGKSRDLAGNPRVFSRASGKTLADDPSALPDLGCFERQDSRSGFCLIVR